METLTIVIPVYNEGENISVALNRIKQEVNVSCVVTIVYDFEDDTTIPVVKNMVEGFDMPLNLVKNKYGRGVLNAIKTGLEAVETEFAVVTMADLSDPPSVINDMVQKAEAGSFDIVCASRYMKGGSQSGGGVIKPLLSRFAGMSLYFLAGIPTHDSTNSFKLYRKSFLEQVSIESKGGFELGLELVVKAHLNGFKLTEVATSWTDRVEGKSNFKLIQWLPCYLKWYFMAIFRLNKV